MPPQVARRVGEDLPHINKASSSTKQIEPYDQERWPGSFCQARRSRSNVEVVHVNAFGIGLFVLFFSGPGNPA